MHKPPPSQTQDNNHIQDASNTDIRRHPSRTSSHHPLAHPLSLPQLQQVPPLPSSALESAIDSLMDNYLDTSNNNNNINNNNTGISYADSPPPQVSFQSFLDVEDPLPSPTSLSNTNSYNNTLPPSSPLQDTHPISLGTHPSAPFQASTHPNKDTTTSSHKDPPFSPPPDEDWFLDYYAENPSVQPPIKSIQSPTASTSFVFPPPPPLDPPKEISPVSMRRTLTTSSVASPTRSSSQPNISLLSSPSTTSSTSSTTSYKTANEVHIPARQSSRTAVPLRQKAAASQLAQYSSTISTQSKAGILESRAPLQLSKSPEPPTSFLSHTPPPTTNTRSQSPFQRPQSFRSTQSDHIEHLLESGCKSLRLLANADAISLWKQACASAPDGSLHEARAWSNLCVGYRRIGDFAGSMDAVRQAFRILERGIWTETTAPAADTFSINAGLLSQNSASSAPYRNGSIHSVASSSNASTSSAPVNSSSGSNGPPPNTGAVMNLLVGVGLIGFDESAALGAAGTEDAGGYSRKGSGMNLPRSLGGRKASLPLSVVSFSNPQHQQQYYSSMAAQPHVPLRPVVQPGTTFSVESEKTDSDDGASHDPVVASMRAVIRVVKRWLERRRSEIQESLKSSASAPSAPGKLPPAPSPKLMKLGSTDSFSNVAADISIPPIDSTSILQIQIDPVVLVALLDICTNAGNLYYTTESYKNATIFHEACLDLSQDILTTFPLPSKHSSPTASIKLSYLHANTLLAKNRSMSHLGLCLAACGDVHRAVRFGQLALTSMQTVAGPQPVSKAGPHAVAWRHTTAGIAGNMGRAQFAVGRYVEGMRGCVAAVDAYAREETYSQSNEIPRTDVGGGDGGTLRDAVDKAGVLRALNNVAALWIETGRLGSISAVWVSDTNRPELGTSSSKRTPTYAMYDEPLRMPKSVSSLVTSPKSNGTTHATGLSIPQRKHSAMRSTVAGADIDLGPLSASTVSKVRQNAPLWFADVFKGIRLLQKVILEAAKVKYLECIGSARFNLAAACIIVHQPYIAARLLAEAPYTWKDIMKQTTLLSKDTEVSLPLCQLDTSQRFSLFINGSMALYNFTQLFFVVSSCGLSRRSSLQSPNETESNAIEYISKIVLSATLAAEASSDGIGANLENRSNRPLVTKTDTSLFIDPDVLVVSLKLCLKLFDGSPYGPYTAPITKIKSVEDPMSPKTTIFTNSTNANSFFNDTIAKHSRSETANAGARSPGLVNMAAQGRNNPSLVLPDKPQPTGSPTSYTTRICLAIARTLISAYAPTLDRSHRHGHSKPGGNGSSQRRVQMLRHEARKWCGAQANAGIENAANASFGSSAMSRPDKGLPSRSDTLNSSLGTASKHNDSKRRSLVVKGSALEALLVSALSGTGEVHGNLAMEVGSVALEVEILASKDWDLDALVKDRIGMSPGASSGVKELGIVHRLVRLTSRRIRDGVIAPVRWEEALLEESLSPFV